MKLETKRTDLNSFQADLKVFKNFVYERCDFELTNFQMDVESITYGACIFQLNERKIQYRISKITPLKIGQFVTIWKRNAQGMTEPFDIFDTIDFVIITTKNHNKIGQFIFPKSVLIDKGIFSTKNKLGKRGIRVYPTWDIPISVQAQKTQAWQLNYFLILENDFSTDLDQAHKLLTNKI